MKRLFLIVVAAALAACGGHKEQGGPSPQREPGESSARSAVDAFLGSIKKQDLQATSAVWGTAKGPARDSDKMTRSELEMRVLTMQCYLGHDSYRVLNDYPGDEGRRIFRVELTNGLQRRQTNFTTIQGPHRRWFVESVDLNPTKDFCRTPPAR